MKKTLLTLLLLLIQIGNCESVGNLPLASQSQAERLAYQDVNEIKALERSDAINEKDWDEKVEAKPSGSVAGTVAKVVGFTLLGLAGAYAALVITVIMGGGVGGC